MTLPDNYSWLPRNLAENAQHPLMVTFALALYGTHEGNGWHNNPVIMGWVKELAALPGKDVAFTNDHRQAWCGLFMGHIAHVADKPFPDKPLWALNWSLFGQPSPEASLGDVLVFTRNGGGHVGLYVGEDDTAFHVLGGNESDQVNIVRESRGRLHSVRRPVYKAPPNNVKPYKLAPEGGLSQNEV